jgi:hypothetical protein
VPKILCNWPWSYGSPEGYANLLEKQDCNFRDRNFEIGESDMGGCGPRLEISRCFVLSELRRFLHFVQNRVRVVELAISCVAAGAPDLDNLGSTPQYCGIDFLGDLSCSLVIVFCKAQGF